MVEEHEHTGGAALPAAHPEDVEAGNAADGTIGEVRQNGFENMTSSENNHENRVQNNGDNDHRDQLVNIKESPGMPGGIQLQNMRKNEQKNIIVSDSGKVVSHPLE